MVEPTDPIAAYLGGKLDAVGALAKRAAEQATAAANRATEAHQAVVAHVAYCDEFKKSIDRRLRESDRRFDRLEKRRSEHPPPSDDEPEVTGVHDTRRLAEASRYYRDARDEETLHVVRVKRFAKWAAPFVAGFGMVLWELGKAVYFLVAR